MSKTNPSQRGSSAAVVFILNSFLVLALLGLIQWQGIGNKLGERSSGLSFSRRMLGVFDEQDAPNLEFDDDGTRSETCKEYLYNFLNGTTDVNDQCQGFYQAYKSADCQDEKDKLIPALDHRHEDENGTIVDDDVIIDDFFENWECCDSIKRFYEKNCPQEESLHSVRLLGIMLVLLVCTSVKAMLKRVGAHWLPDACAFIIVGAIVGGILRLGFGSLAVNTKLSFDNDLFLQILLPPIIFQAALSIDKRAFRRDLFPILSFASIGTAFSAIAIGLVTHHVSSFMGEGSALPLLDSLVFGSLISSIDPVATLGILSQVGVSQTDTLYTLIFGESLLNDGVAIVLFDTLKSYLGDETVELGPAAYRNMFQHFAGVLFGSIGIGLGCGICCTVYFWALRGRQTAVTEVMIFFTWSLIPYYIADGLSCSGIIAIMVMGFFMDYFVIGGFQSDEATWMDYMILRSDGDNPLGLGDDLTHDRWMQLRNAVVHAFSGRGHILSRSRNHVGFVAQVIATLMDTAIFAYLGLFLFSDNVWHLRLSLTAILGCVSSRAIMVVALSILINACVYLDVEGTIGRLLCALRGRTNMIEEEAYTSERVYVDSKTQAILLLAGVRGAVSFALMESIPVYNSVTKTGSRFKPELKAMTSSSIVFTLFVFGALTYFTVEFGNHDRRESRVMGSLTHRRMSEPLDSDDEAQTNTDFSDMNSLLLEVEQRQLPTQPQLTGGSSSPYVPPGEANPQPEPSFDRLQNETNTAFQQSF